MSQETLTTACAGATRGCLLVVTGAGISLASGIPTFRGSDPDAVWSKDVTELGTVDYFRRDPVGSWSWYLRRFELVFKAAPNPAHHALVALERWQVARGGEFLLVTQNVDTLHDQAGSQALVHVHGRADRFRCTGNGCLHAAPKGSVPRDEAQVATFLADPCLATVPRCPACGALLRQHVLWFDEYYSGHRDYEIERVLRAAKHAHVVVFVGTSFSVGVTDMILESALARGAHVFSIDPAAVHALPHRRVQPITTPAELALPALVAALTPAG